VLPLRTVSSAASTDCAMSCPCAVVPPCAAAAQQAIATRVRRTIGSETLREEVEQIRIIEARLEASISGCLMEAS